MAVDVSVIRAAIVAALTAAGAENIYTEDPLLVDWDTIIEKLRQEDTQFIQCWVIRRVGSIPLVSETDYGKVPIGCAVFWHHTFHIMMFFGYIENTSEDQMQDLIDTILTAFQTNRTLGNTVFGIQRPLSLQSIQPRELGGISGYEATFALMVEAHELGLTPV